MLSSKTLNICPVSFKSNYAKSRRRPGSKTSLWSSPSCSCFTFSVNVRSMMPSPDDVRQLRELKKTFLYNPSACVTRAVLSSCLTAIWGFAFGEPSVFREAQLITTSSPYPSICEVYYLNWATTWDVHRRTYPSMRGYYDDVQHLGGRLYSIAFIDCLFDKGKGVHPGVYSAGYERLLARISILLEHSQGKKSPYASQKSTHTYIFDHISEPDLHVNAA